MITYADTSFLVSLYVHDANSQRAASIMKTATLPVLTTEFGEIELLNSFYSRVFRREMSESAAVAAVKDFREDVDNAIFEIRPLNSKILETTKGIIVRRTGKYGNRTADILHVAAAISYAAAAFLSFDRRQAKLALIEGLRTP